MKKVLLNGALIGAVLTILAQPVYADQVINDDLIVNGDGSLDNQGSACIGSDCVNGESFGFTTLRLKENNLRIEFNDTSSSGTNVDWGIRTNDSSNGGDNYFGIAELLSGDVNSDPLTFRIDAGAPELSLHIDDQGNLNLATSTARIINLADPVNDTDATNLRTVNSVVSSKLTPDWLSSTSQAQATSSGVGSTAIGAGASAKSYDTAIGYKATITADNSTAVGANSQVHSANSVAIGANSNVASGAEGGVAVGENAKVLNGATNSVALGKDSIASEPNTVSVGSPGNERRITNVADGVNSTDAVNKGQLDAVSSRVSANRKNIKINRQRIEENSEAISENSSEINRLQGELETANAGVAAAASLVVMTPSAPGKTTLNLEGASYEGQYGIGFSIAHRLSSPAIGDDFYLNAGISTSSGKTLTRVGGSWEF